MDKIIVSITTAAIALILILVSYLWYRFSVPAMQDDILYVMRIPRRRLLLGILGILFGFAMTIPFWREEDNWFTAFAFFYLFMLFYEYWCVMVLLWRCAIREDSLTIHMPLLPAKEIKFHEIEYVYYTDNHTLGMSVQKKLEGYRGRKKLFSIEEEIYGFPLLYTLLNERGIVGCVPSMEHLKKEDSLQRVSLMESFTVTEKTEDRVKTVLIDLLILVPCMAYILWNREEFELIYQAAALIMLLILLPNALSTLLWQVTMDYQTISIRTFPGITRTYEIRQITEVIELENFIVLYVGKKKIVKIAKDSKNFPYLFERLLQTEAEIYRKF